MDKREISSRVSHTLRFPEQADSHLIVPGLCLDYLPRDVNNFGEYETGDYVSGEDFVFKLQYVDMGTGETTFIDSFEVNEVDALEEKTLEIIEELKGNG